MRIACPSCSAAYDVPDSLLPGGRIVRCARCGNEWMAVRAEAPAAPPDSQEHPASAGPEAPAPLAAAEPPAREVDRPAHPPRISAMDRLAAHPAALPASRGLQLAWAASFLLLALLGWGVYAWRVQIMDHWPPSTRMYAAFGLQAAPRQTP